MEPPIVHVIALPSSRLFWLRVVALLFSCVAFSFRMKVAVPPPGDMIDCCVFSFGISLTCTLSILLLELRRIHNRIPVIWTNVTITVACYAALFWLVTSIIFSVFFIRNQMYSKVRNDSIIATVFFFLATAAYLGEVILSKVRPREEVCYMTTALGMMKVCQTFVACVIFIMVSIPRSYNECAPLQWCMAVYCICFILSMVVVVLCVRERKDYLSITFLFYLSMYEVLAVLMYLSATILWPLFQFHRQYNGKGSEATNDIAVSVLTGLNLLLYMADLACCIRIICRWIEAELSEDD